MKVYVDSNGKAKVGRRVLRFPASLRGAWVDVEEPAQSSGATDDKPEGDTDESEGE